MARLDAAEIGVHMALRAAAFTSSISLRSRAFVVVLTATILGVVASLIVSQKIGAFVFGVTLYDPVTMASVILVILAVTASAGYLPARRR
jgi:ABC-type antimicrobial peptide transport system permease subunit